MLTLLLAIGCFTEVGLIGYVEKDRDTSEVIDTAQPDYPNNGITAYAHYKLRQVACPACVGESQEITITFKTEFHQPSSDDHTGWIEDLSGCVTDLFTVSPSTVPDSVGSNLTVTAPGHTFQVPQVGTGVYETNQIWEAQYQRDSLYTVESDEGDFLFVSSHGFDYIEPYTMFWVEPFYAYDTPMKASEDNYFSWSPTSNDSDFIITVAVYSWDGSQFLGHVACKGPDNGQMKIPGHYFQQFPPGSLAAIHLARHKVELVETDINNSFVETHMEWEVVGTGMVQ